MILMGRVAHLRARCKPPARALSASPRLLLSTSPPLHVSSLGIAEGHAVGTVDEQVALHEKKVSAS